MDYKFNLKPVIIFFLLVFFFFLLWIKLKFGKIHYHMIIVNLQILSNELFQSNGTIKNLNIISSFFKWVVILPISITLIWSLFFFFKKFTHKVCNFLYQYLFIFSVIFLLMFIFYILQKTVHVSFKSNENFVSEIDYFEKNFKPLDNLKIIDPNNLILVILESYDRDFINSLDSSLLDEIDNLSLTNFISYEIKNFYSHNSAQISLHAQVAYLCGIHLNLGKPNSHIPFFFKNHLCLQDIFNLNNYKTELIMNTSVYFHDSQRFYLYHYFDELFDANYFNNSTSFDKNYYSLFRSINDQDLLSFAEDRLRYLDKLNQNYFMVISTLDTHSPGNYYDKNKCGNIIKNENVSKFTQTSSYFLNNQHLFSNQDIDLINNVFNNRDWVLSNIEKINSFKCTNKHLIKFLKFIDKSNLDTNVLLISDHAYSGDGVGKKKLFNKLLTKKKINLNQIDNFYPFDILPTLLDISGYEMTDKKIYHGYSAINSYDLPINRDQIFSNIFKSFSQTYNNLW